MRRHIVHTAVLATCFLLFAYALYIHFLTVHYGDKQWEMLYAHMWVAGKNLYRDIYPVSPPLITWLYALPDMLAAGTGPDREYAMLFASGTLLMLVSACACVWLIRRHAGFAKRRKSVEFLVLLIFVLMFRTSPIFYLDREHLFLVLTLPYLLRFSPGLASRKIPLAASLGIGLLAAVGFNIKPYCFIVFLGVQLVFAALQRSSGILRSAENLVVYALTAAYLLAIYHFNPEYFHTVLPMALATYAATRDETPVWIYLENALLTVLVPALAVFFTILVRHNSPYRKDIAYLLFICPFFALYAFANNNWAYTYYPLGSIALIAVGYILWEALYLRRIARSQFRPSWPYMACVLVCMGVFAFKIYLTLGYFSAVAADGCIRNVHCKGDDRLAAVLQEPKAEGFGAITIDFSRWTRLAYFTGAQWQTRFPQLWMLPRFLASPKEFSTSHAWILDYIANAYADDMSANRPPVMFVDDTDVFYTARVQVDLVAYLSVNARFKDAWSHYRLAERINLCAPAGVDYHGPKEKCSYDVYRRVD